MALRPSSAVGKLPPTSRVPITYVMYSPAVGVALFVACQLAALLSTGKGKGKGKGKSKGKGEGKGKGKGKGKEMEVRRRLKVERLMGEARRMSCWWMLVNEIGRDLVLK